jgi:hypothetical protein
VRDGKVRAVALSPDARTALTGSRDKTARLWNAATGKQIAALVHGADVNAVAFSPDGRTVLTGCASRKGEARLWDTATGKESAILHHDHAVVAVAYSLDGRTILTGCAASLSRGEARLWDATTGKVITALRHRGVHAMAFSPDGRTALAAGRGIRLWDIATGKEIASLRYNGWVNAVAFSPDGRTALTACSDKTARLWTLPVPPPDDPGRLRAWVQVRTVKCFSKQGPLRDLTHAEWLEQCRRLDALGGDWQPAPDARAWHRHQAAEAEFAKQWYGAAFHLRRLLASDQGNVEYLERLGAALHRDGRHAEAIARLTEAVAKSGQGGTVAMQLYLAMAHQRLGHAADAQTWLARAVRQIGATKNPRPADAVRWANLRREAEKLLKRPRP